MLDSRYTYDEGTQQPGRIDRSTQFYSAWTLFCVLAAGLDAGDHADEAGAAVRRRRRHVKGGSADRVEVRYRAKSFRQVGPDEVVKIRGSDHTVLMSRPSELCSHLLTIDDGKYC